MADQDSGKWKELTGKIRQKWTKLSDADVEEAYGNWDELADRLQKSYGYSREQADSEIGKFKRTLQ